MPSIRTIRRSTHRPALPAVVLLAVTAAACGKDSTGPRAQPGIRAIAGADVEDTVLAERVQALVVEVEDSTGQRRAGLTVRFEAARSTDTTRRNERAVWVCGASVSACGEQLGGDGQTSYPGSFSSADTTDALGRAVAGIRHGTLAAASHVIVTVPELGMRDSFPVRTLAGGAARVSSTPADTAVRMGRALTLRAVVEDRFGNAREDQVSFTHGSRVTRSGSTFTGAQVGRERVIVRAGTGADTSYVTVVPDGRVAGAMLYSGTLIIANFDGSERVTHVLGSRYPDGGYRPSWRPDGKLVASLVGASGRTAIHVVDPVTAAATAMNTRESGDGEWYPLRSPSDGSVYFTAAVSGGSFYELRRLSSDGATETTIPLAGTAVNRFRPDVSPDGSRIAVMSFGSGGYGLEVQIFNLATGEPIGPAIPGATAPRWSPDGQWLAVGSNYNGPLRVVRADGTGLRTVSTDYYGEWVDWTADGQWLVARLNRLVLVNVATGEVLQLPAGLAGIDQAAVRR